MIKIICQINQEILKALKNNGNISKAFQLNVPIVGEDLLRCSCFIYSPDDALLRKAFTDILNCCDIHFTYILLHMANLLKK